MPLFLILYNLIHPRHLLTIERLLLQFWCHLEVLISTVINLPVV
jgi:hypothetical protein